MERQRMPKKPNLSAIELFAGIGGFRIACDELGIKTVWANDMKKNACGVYRKRFGSNEMVEGDIKSLKSIIPSDFDILTGGFPCQPFSGAGKKKGVFDVRGTLFRDIKEIVQKRKPKAFILENVKRILGMQKGGTFKTILTELSSLNYQIEWRIVNVRSFGLPQNRERILIIGIREDVLSNNQIMHDVEATNYSELKGVKTSKLEEHEGAFSFWGRIEGKKVIQQKLESKVSDFGDAKLKDHLQPPSEVSDRFDFTESTIERLGGNTPRNKFVHGVEILSNQEGGRRMGYTIFGENGIAPTLTATTSRIYERYKIGEVYRILTNVEYGRLQGFEDDHCNHMIIGGKDEMLSPYKQYPLYGNAIPPHLAKWGLQIVVSQINN
jgi:DNA (cytosine-5)-methyltransferase 1